MKKLLLICSLSILAPVFISESIAADNSFDTTKKSLQSAMKAEIRTEKDTDRDRNRMPIETLEFFGFRNNMKVIELLPFNLNS